MTNKKATQKKLHIKRETVRHLDRTSLGRAVGGLCTAAASSCGSPNTLYCYVVTAVGCG